MKRIITFCLLILSGNLFSQSQWENVPQSTQFSPTDIEFTDLNNGWASTITGYIAHTSDGGNSWSLQANYDLGGVRGIDMLSATHGYAAGSRCILETTDGEHWNPVVIDSTNSFEDVSFLNDTLGIARLSGYMIWKTTDGGQSWDTIFINPNFYLQAFQFVDENTIIAVGQDPGAGNMIVSHDGGLTWTQPQEAAGLWLTDVFFTNSLTGYIIGQGGVFMTTSDGGLTWQSSTQFQNLLQSNPSIYFTTASTGFVMAQYGQCFRTADGGVTWTDMTETANRNYESIHFMDSLHGWAASSVLTEIITTSDGGLTWSSLYTGSGWGLTDIEFSSNNEGWACGVRGTVLHTTDGGNTWSLVESPLQYIYTNLEIVTPQKIWIIDETGLAFHTADGGTNWHVSQVSQPGNGGSLRDIDFPTPQIGYVVGSSHIYSTQNGGASWQDTWSPGVIYSGVSFLNADSGMVNADNALLRTIDGGLTWETITPTGTYFFSDIAYPAQDTAYVVGGEGLILSTYDGGNTWVEQNSGTTNTLTDISFSSSTTGRASGYNGTILITQDAGVTWLPEVTPSSVQISAIAITPSNDGWASKIDGNFLNFHCSPADSIDVNTYTSTPTSNCNGSVILSSVSGESFVTNVSGQNQVVNPSADFTGFCEGLYAVSGYNSCGSGLNGQFVIPDPAHFFGAIGFMDSTIVAHIGNVQELCGQQLSSVSSAGLATVSSINATTIQAEWEIITASGTVTIPALYEISENGVYAIQLSLYCEGNVFEGLVVSENVYVEGNTVVLKTPELQAENFTVFPNPASGNITIRFESELANLIVRDVNGKQLLSKEITPNDQVDLSTFSNGIFLFEISTKNGRTVERVIKN